MLEHVDVKLMDLKKVDHTASDSDRIGDRAVWSDELHYTSDGWEEFNEIQYRLFSIGRDSKEHIELPGQENGI